MSLGSPSGRSRAMTSGVGGKEETSSSALPCCTTVMRTGKENPGEERRPSMVYRPVPRASARWLVRTKPPIVRAGRGAAAGGRAA
jgi:hypothetical protein